MPKKTTKQNLKTFVKGVLRRASYQWKARNQALVNARVERGKYKCAHCEELFGPKEVQIDHIKPVIDPRVGFTTWDIYIERLYCETEDFQVLCTSCHDAKTFLEDQLREIHKTEKDQLENHKRRKNKKKEEKVDE